MHFVRGFAAWAVLLSRSKGTELLYCNKGGLSDEEKDAVLRGNHTYFASAPYFDSDVVFK